MSPVEATSAPAEVTELPYPSALRANLLLGLLVAAYICSFLDRQILSLMVGPIRASLKITDFQVSLVQGVAFALFFAAAGLPLGRLADRASRTRLIAAGMFFWSMMTIACGLANSFLTLFVARIGLGIGEAALAPAGFSLLADAFRPTRLVRATAIFSLGSLLGAGLAFFVGGGLIDYLGQSPRPLQIGQFEPWQMAFMLVALPALILVPVLLLMPEPARRGQSGAPTKTPREVLAYIWRRRRDYAPFYLCPSLLAVLNYGGLTWLPTHLIRHFDMPPGKVGAILGVIQLASSLGGALVGAALTEFFQRRGRKDAHLRTVAIVSLGAAAGLTAPLMPSLEATFALWTLAAICLGAYFGSVMAALQLMTPSNMRASNTALLLTCLTISGLAVGTAAIGGLADLAFPGLSAGIGYSIALIGIPAALASALAARRGCANFADVTRRGFGEVA